MCEDPLCWLSGGKNFGGSKAKGTRSFRSLFFKTMGYCFLNIWGNNILGEDKSHLGEGQQKRRLLMHWPVAGAWLEPILAINKSITG